MVDEQELVEERDPEAVAGELVSAGRQKVRQAVQYVATAASGMVVVMVGSWVMSMIQSRAPVEISGAPTPAAAASDIQPRPDYLQAPQQIVVQPQETEADRRIMQILHQLTTAVDNLAAEVHVSSGAQAAPVGQTPDVVEASTTSTQDVVAAPTATPEPVLSIWEDGGGCWTPSTATVLHLCGAPAGDGYVVRWVGVPGDNRGPEIPDSDWLAVRGGGDRLVWSGAHPATGEVVSVTYWSAGHVLAVHAAGRLLFRIDRVHEVK